MYTFIDAGTRQPPQLSLIKECRNKMNNVAGIHYCIMHDFVFESYKACACADS